MATSAARSLILLVFGLALLATGCAGSGPVPEDHFYRLVTAPAAQSGSPTLEGVLEIERFSADGLMQERPLLFSRGGGEFQVHQHHYHYWIEPPTQLLQEELAAYARRRGLAGTVVTPGARIRVDFAVSGRVRRFERIIGDGSPRVRVELRLELEYQRIECFVEGRVNFGAIFRQHFNEMLSAAASGHRVGID